MLDEAGVHSEISSLIHAVESGEATTAEPLFTAMYSELHKMARSELACRGSNLPLGTTTLLHEAYLDMAGRDGTTFPDRARFMAYAARVMRGLVLNYARDEWAQRRGG